MNRITGVIAALCMMFAMLFVAAPSFADSGVNTRCVEGTNASVPGTFCVKDRWQTQADGAGITVTDVWVYLSGCDNANDWNFPAASYSIRLRDKYGNVQWTKDDALYKSLGCSDHFSPNRNGTKEMYFNFFGTFSTQSDGASGFDVNPMSVD